MAGPRVDVRCGSALCVPALFVLTPPCALACQNGNLAWLQVIKVPEGAVLRGCKKTRRKLREHLRLRAEIHSQLRFIASLFVLRIFLTCLVGYPTPGSPSPPQPPAVQPPHPPDAPPIPPLPPRAPAQPASMECDTDSDSESDCGSEPEPQSDSESEPEPVTQPPQRRCSARLAALAPAMAPAAPTGPPLPLDCEDPLMLRQLKDFCKFFANPNFKTCYNQLQRRHVRNRHPMLMPAFEDPSNQALVAKLQELGSIYLAGDANTIDAHSMQLAVAMQQHYSNPGKPRGKDQDGGRVVLVDEHRTSRVSSAVNGKQPCEVELNTPSATRPAGWKPTAGQVEPRLVRPAWSQDRGQPVRGLVWCPVVAPRRPPQAPRSGQAATQPAASEPGPSTPQPAKRSKRTKAEPGAAEPTKGKGKGKAAKAKPAPQPGRWLDRDCNAALNMQRIGESRWRPLELCFWPEQGALPAKGKEYPGLGYKRLRDKPPKAQEQQQQPAVAHMCKRSSLKRLSSLKRSSLKLQAQLQAHARAQAQAQALQDVAPHPSGLKAAARRAEAIALEVHAKNELLMTEVEWQHAHEEVLNAIVHDFEEKLEHQQAGQRQLRLENEALEAWMRQHQLAMTLSNKQATRTLPKLTLRPEVLRLYLASSTWVLGTGLDLLGAVLMIAAFAQAPVSVVQPVSAVGLAILLIFSHFYLKERLRPAEWLSACIAFAGVLGLGVSSEPEHLEHPDHLHPFRIVMVFLAMLAMLGAPRPSSSLPGGPKSGIATSVNTSHPPHSRAESLSHLTHLGHTMEGVDAAGEAAAAGGPEGGQQQSGPYPHNHQAGVPGGVASQAAAAAATDAVLCGLEGGACFGFSAAACRTGFILARRVSLVWAPLGLLSSVLLTSSGFMLQTRGLKAGSTVVVCTMAAVASMVTGVLAGLLALGEALPSTHAMRLARLASWLAILLGVSSLADIILGVLQSNFTQLANDTSPLPLFEQCCSSAPVVIGYPLSGPRCSDSAAKLTIAQGQEAEQPAQGQGQEAEQPAQGQGQEAEQPAQGWPDQRTKAEPGAAEPTKGKGKGKGKAAKAKPAPQPGRWLDRDCNAALNMQRIGESRWRPLELCYWPDQGALPAKGKEYPGLGYKRLRDKPPKAQEQQQQPAEAQ
ncbi:hypothetical protein QJQ45_021650 [Haematococcus lacustris]|nr:hypothetical protein QJQ45_021650 [Haematococcus lacustris]